jgi:hypothetical protein
MIHTCAGAKIIGSKNILGTTDGAGLTRIKMQGCAWQAKLALRFQIPSQASLHGIVKTHHPIASRPSGQPPVAPPRTCPVLGCG